MSLKKEDLIYEDKILWSQLDANMHLRHSAYADIAAHARFEILGKLGFGPSFFKQYKIGPVLFREELIYKREIIGSEKIKIDCELTKSRADGSRWGFRQHFYREDGVLSAIINVEGAWIDMEKRKLIPFPSEHLHKLMSIPKSEDYVEEAVSI